MFFAEIKKIRQIQVGVRLRTRTAAVRETAVGGYSTRTAVWGGTGGYRTWIAAFKAAAVCSRGREGLPCRGM